MTPKIRLYVDLPLNSGMAIEPSPAQSHYLLTVMRQRTGDAVGLFNGRDGEWLAVLEPTGRRWCRLDVDRQLREQAPEPGPGLVFAPLKRTRQEFLVEKATELGAARLQPVFTERSVVDRLNRERLRTIAIEAAEQSGRLTVPEVGIPTALEVWLAERPPDGSLYLADEARDGPPLLQALAEHGAGDLLVGPEGGFSPAEREALHGREDVVPISLGPRVLRAETAALAALACWQALLAKADGWTSA